MAAELAAGYLSLTVRYKDAQKGIGALFENAQKQALKSGDKAGSDFSKAALASGARGNSASKWWSPFTRGAAAEGQKAGQQFTKGAESATSRGRVTSLFSGAARTAQAEGTAAGSRFGEGFKTALKASGVVAAAGALAVGFKAAITTGVDFERTMNTLSGVTGATADQMSLLRQRAKDLGNDVSLSGTSAVDASQAMTELAKAGFTVDQSMTAAKGTLQLAAAAQISAAEAATIQANALQVFGLKADYAAKTADVLANTANATSADITDVAFAMQAGGSVASQFGLTLEDTAAAIGMLANNGIKGSDAGTLLKATLLALTDQSNPAQGAIQELGLTVYNASGQFVGMSSLLGQLGEAAKRMTPEMYQAATGTLFGSDAARLAGIAAKGGSEGYDQLRKAVEKQGAAADLAAAQNKGLPGVIERIKNAVETASISFFELIDGPLQSVGDGLTGFVNTMQTAFASDSVKQAASTLGTAIGGVGKAIGEIAQNVGPALISGLSEAVNLFERFKAVIIPLVAGFVAYKTTVLVIIGITKLWAAAQAILNIALTANPIGLIVAAIAALVAGVILAYKNSETFRKIVQTAWAAIKTVVGVAWSFLKTVFAAMKPAFEAIGTAAMWLWENAIKPAWEGIKQGIGLAWEVVSDIFNNWVRVGRIVGEGAMWLWNNAIKPAWDGIRNAISAAWDFVSPILDKFQAGWDSLKSGISGAASAIKDAVTSAFSGLAAVIKAPLKILGGFLSAIPDKIFTFDVPGADKLNQWGKSLQGFSGGGPVRGPGTGTSDSILAWLSDGEGVVTAKGMSNGGAGIVAALNAGWVPSASYLRDMMIPGFAEGLNPGANYLRSMVMKLWPQISSIGGRRSEDGFGEHSSGNALDIMIPDYSSPMGKALGDAVAAFVVKNAAILGLDGLIWRQTSYGYGGSLTDGKSMPDRGSDTQNHMDHLHVMLGKGRGSGASAVGLPTSSVSLPSGGSASVSPLGFGSGSSGGGASSKQTREADDRINDLSNRLDVTEQELADLESNPKAKETTKQRKRDMVDKLKRDLQQAKDDRAGLDLQGGSSSGGSANNPIAKISEGLKELMPNFGELADTGVGGLTETLLPDGFSNPMDWGIFKAGSTLLKFFGGLRKESDGSPLLGEGGAAFANIAGSAMGGSGSGVVDAITGLLPQPFGGGMAQPGDFQGGNQLGRPGMDPAVGFVPGQNPGIGGGPMDQSTNVNFNGPVGANAGDVVNKVNDGYNSNWRRNFGTARVGAP